LSIAGRDDVKSHVLQLPRNVQARNYVPQINVEDKIKLAKQLSLSVEEKTIIVRGRCVCPTCDETDLNRAGGGVVINQGEYYEIK
jgi:hypothetical protein